MERLVASMPQLRTHQVLFYEVCANNAKYRNEIVSKARNSKHLKPVWKEKNERFPNMSSGHMLLCRRFGAVEIVVGWWNCMQLWFVHRLQRKWAIDLWEGDCWVWVLRESKDRKITFEISIRGHRRVGLHLYQLFSIVSIHLYSSRPLKKERDPKYRSILFGDIKNYIFQFRWISEQERIHKSRREHKRRIQLQ